MNIKILLSVAFILINNLILGQIRLPLQALPEPNINKFIDSTSYFRQINNNNNSITRSAAGRRYSYLNSLEAKRNFYGLPTMFLPANRKLVPIWQDSTILQQFSSGYSSINYRMGYNVIDPKSNVFNSLNWNTNGQQGITNEHSYTVDTIWVAGVYIKEKPNLTNDKLVLTIVRGQDAQIFNYNFPQATHPLAKQLFYNNTADTAMLLPGIEIDSFTVTPGLTAAVRTQIEYTFLPTDTNVIKFYPFVLSTPLAINKNTNVAFGVQFKSGDTWVPNVTKLKDMNRFSLVYFEEQLDSLAVYRHGSAGDYDKNTSGLMFSWENWDVHSSVALEYFSSPKNYENEHLDAMWHLKSPAAYTLNIADMPIIQSFNFAPNPATELTYLKANISNISINKPIPFTISNMYGQKVFSTQLQLTNQALVYPINTSLYPKGIYTCTLNINGINYSKLLVVQ
jgi:hypothetical protein